MAGQGFLARVAGRTKQLFGLQTSAGAADAGKIVALNSDGKIDITMLPAGVGANTVTAPASEALSAGDFVNLYDNAGVLSARKADNSNNRQAHGFVTAAVTSSATATVYRLNTTNANRSGLTAGGNYWLGTSGGVISTPLDPAVDVGKTDQYLGIAKSTTELVTAEYEPVLL
jgi:hypothetical protein